MSKAEEYHSPIIQEFFDATTKEDQLEVDVEMLQIALKGVDTELYQAKKALKKIAKWELPETGKFWDDEKTRPMSFEVCYGSNGVRDYFKHLAQYAL